METPADRRTRVAVVFGGRSTEHAVSCATAASVIAALDPARYDVVPVGITPGGRWVVEDADPERLRIRSADDLPAVRPEGPGLAVVPGSGGTLVGDGAPRATGAAIPEALSGVDVVFPVLHGPWGEDGTVQGLLEMVGVRYVGAGVLASAVGMDKHAMKLVLTASGLPVLPHVLVTARRWAQDRAACREEVAALGYPVFVKPARGGSSIGISRVGSAEELDAAVEAAAVHDPRVLVEAAAAGARELECGVLDGLDGSAPRASVVAEITIGDDHDFYDFAAKYLPEESTGLHVPADLPEEVADRVRELSVATFEALGCEGLARVDFFLTADGGLVVNELNTMPGFTPSSMFPRMWAATGMDYPALVDRLVALALERGTGLR